MILKSSKKFAASGTQEAEVSMKELRSASLKWKYLTLLFGFCSGVLTIAIVILVCGWLYLNQTPTTEPPLNPVFSEIPKSDGVPLGKVRFISRDEWGAQPPTQPLTKLRHPVPYVIISHTATDLCTGQSECTFRVRFVQTFHIESRNWSDIGYNFLVGGDGYAYMGRSWDFVGAHSYNYNNRSIGISFIGKFDSVVPPKSQLHAAQQIIKLGVESGKIAADYKLLGHRQISKTLSPGDALYSVIKTWPHWTPTP